MLKRAVFLFFIFTIVSGCATQGTNTQQAINKDPVDISKMIIYHADVLYNIPCTVENTYFGLHSGGPATSTDAKTNFNASGTTPDKITINGNCNWGNNVILGSDGTISGACKSHYELTGPTQSISDSTYIINGKIACSPISPTYDEAQPVNYGCTGSGTMTINKSDKFSQYGSGFTHSENCNTSWTSSFYGKY